MAKLPGNESGHPLPKKLSKSTRRGHVIPMEAQPVLHFERNNPIGPPVVSVVVPVYNQAHIIGANLESIAEFADQVWELIIIDDASTDATLVTITETVKAIMDHSSNLARARIFAARKSMFETRCDSFGFRRSTAPVIIEIQADMRITGPRFMSRLAQALNSSADLFMLSGRGVHPFQEVVTNYLQSNGSDRKPRSPLAQLRKMKEMGSRLAVPISSNNRSTGVLRDGTPAAQSADSLDTNNPLDPQVCPGLESFILNGKAGRLGRAIETHDSVEEEHVTKIWVGETVMRGPLAIHRERYLEVGGLDETRFFQGFDDHDLALRGLLHGYRVGFMPVEFSSPLAWGTTRKRRTLRADLTIRREIKRIRNVWKESALAGFPIVGAKQPLPEIRTLASP